MQKLAPPPKKLNISMKSIVLKSGIAVKKSVSKSAKLGKSVKISVLVGGQLLGRRRLVPRPTFKPYRVVQGFSDPLSNLYTFDFNHGGVIAKSLEHTYQLARVPLGY